jgi:hypothetical protein
MFAGGILNGWWNSEQMRGVSLNWENVWHFPAVLAAVVLVIFLVTFQHKEA